MLKERTDFVKKLLYFAELSIVTANFFVVYRLLAYFRFFYSLDLLPGIKVVQRPHSLHLYLLVFWLVFLIWAVLLKVKGRYHHLRIQTYREVITRHFFNGLIFFVCFAAGAMLFKFEFLSRTFMIVYTVSTVFLLMLNRLIVMSVAYHLRKKGYNYRNLLLVGTGPRAQVFLGHLSKHSEWGYRVVGLVDRDPALVGQNIAGYKVLGVLEDLPRILEKNVIDEVVLVVPRSWLEEMEKCILNCEAVGVPATLSTDFFDLKIASGVPKEFDGFTYLTFETRRLRESELFLKRSVDIFFSSIILVLTAPLLLMVCLLVKLTSHGHVFFKQTRCSLNGRTFTLYKFRSMVADAEARLEALKELNEMSGPVFKLANDPRLTSIGKFLRKTSLDEFPQFWNVLKGDMSLVGPRPPLPSEVEKYEPWQRRRLSMKPGLSCIWQVSGRNKINFESWMKLDLQYIDKWSIWLDFKIALLTVWAVITRSGAN